MNLRIGSLVVVVVALASGCSKTVTRTKVLPENHGAKLSIAPDSCPAAIGNPALAGVPAQSVAHGQVVLNPQTTLNYTLTTGYLPLYAQGTQSGTIRACLFYWAYTRDDQAASQSTWPVTFLFNGGPTSSSDWIQFGGIGPKKLPLGPEGITVPSSQSLVDDTNTLLANSDLVFIDPINSGISAPAKGVSASDFNGLTQDADSIGDFIKAYLTVANRANSPKYLVGESYGGMRLPVLARYLDEHLGIKLSGITFISPWLDAIGDSEGDDLANDLPYVTSLPEYATTAWYHKKLSADLQALTAEEVFEQADTFATTDYAEALIAGDDVTDAQKQTALAGLARFTSFSTTDILADNLRIPFSEFQTSILKDQGLTISTYDGRMGAVIQNPSAQDPTDLFDSYFLGAVSSTLQTAGVTIGTQYVDAYSPPTWPGANPDGKIEGGYLNVLDDLSTFIEKNAETKIFVVNGLYDFACPAAEVKFMLNHLAAADAAKIQVARYEAGHPVYFGDNAHSLFQADLAALYSGTALPGVTRP